MQELGACITLLCYLFSSAYLYIWSLLRAHAGLGACVALLLWSFYMILKDLLLALVPAAAHTCRPSSL